MWSCPGQQDEERPTMLPSFPYGRKAILEPHVNDYVFQAAHWQRKCLPGNNILANLFGLILKNILFLQGEGLGPPRTSPRLDRCHLVIRCHKPSSHKTGGQARECGAHRTHPPCLCQQAVERVTHMAPPFSPTCLVRGFSIISAGVSGCPQGVLICNLGPVCFTHHVESSVTLPLASFLHQCPLPKK